MRTHPAAFGLFVAGALLAAPASAQQDFTGDPAPGQTIRLEDQRVLPLGGTALDLAEWGRWSGSERTNEMPLYVREAVRPMLRDGVGFSLPFCGPFTPTCP